MKKVIMIMSMLTFALCTAQTDVKSELSKAYKDVKEVVDKLTTKRVNKPVKEDVTQDISDGIVLIIEKINSLYDNNHIDEKIRDEYVDKFTTLLSSMNKWQKG